MAHGAQGALSFLFDSPAKLSSPRLTGTPRSCTDEYSDEVQDLGFHIPLKEGWEITPKAFQVLRDLQPRLRALGPPQDGLLLLDSKELQDASEADLQAVTTAATSLISKGPGEEGALAASRSLVSAEPLKPGHVAYDDTRTSYGMFAKVRTRSAGGNRCLLRSYALHRLPRPTCPR